MDWDGLQVFLTVARTGRLSTAARRLGVEHTTVGRRLAALEADLGTALFYRTAAGYRLTPVGDTVLGHAEAMERAAVATEAHVRETAGAVAGLVRLALVPEFATHWFARHLAAFRARFPDVTLQVVVGTRPLDLSRGEADLAVRMPNPRQTGLVAVRLARASAGLYASKAVVGARRLRVDSTPTSTRGLPLLVYTPRYGILQSSPWFRSLAALCPIGLESNSTHMLLAAARASAGIAVLPRFVARQHEDLIAVSEDVSEQNVWLITHPEYRRDPKIRATADFLVQAAKGPDGLS